MGTGVAASHGLAAPTVPEVREAVRRVCPTDFDETWTAVCRTAASIAAESLPEEGGDLDVVGALCAALKTFPGYLSVVGTSMAIRASCYRTLSAVQRGGQR